MNRYTVISVKKNEFKIIYCILATICLLLMVRSVSHSASGFTMSFYDPPLKVSSYKDLPSSNSVSLGMRIHPTLSSYLKWRPSMMKYSKDKPDATFETNSFRFNVEYYRRGGRTLSLVPVSVDAEKYLAYKLKNTRSRKFHQLATGSNKDGRNTRKGGLGLSLDLPDRLNRLFGEGGAGLRVSGYRKIIFSGRSQWTEGSSSTLYNQSKFPSLHMDQFSKFDITGTIGSKITVKVSQDSQTDIPLANRIQIRYKGDDDDILKVVEAGNTNLSLPNTRFVGYSSQIRGLFGIKAEAQVGHLKLVGIASQEKGSSETARITPTGEESATIIRDYRYAERRIFDLGYEADFNDGDEIVRMNVYQALNTNASITRPATATYARLFVDPDNPGIGGSENEDYTEVSSGMDLVSPDQYEFFTIPDSNKHYIVFNSSKGRYSIGVWMEIKKADGSLYRVGNIDSSIVDLKLIYSSTANLSYKTWDLMWRNIYSVNRGMEFDDFELKIYNGAVGAEDQTTSRSEQISQDYGTQQYLEILGMDLENQNGQSVSDGKLDNKLELYRSDWGLIIFPERRPFDSERQFVLDDGEEKAPLEVKVPLIYDASNNGSYRADASTYFMKIFTKTRSTQIRLGRMNIIEGSEKVTANGRQLKKGTDYSVNYQFGQITLLSEEAKDPNADIDINFDYSPFLAIQKKTLLGLRAEYNWSKDFNIGSTVLYKSDKAEDRKPRVGSETAKTVVYDIDASLKLYPQFLTTLVDALPIVQTTSPSNMSISAEIAQSHPNPNVDGVAYIDDFEASSERLSLGTNRVQWQKSSAPYQFERDGLPFKRSQLLWHNLRTPPLIDDIYPRKDAATGASSVRSLRFVFRPNYLDTIWDSTLVEEEYEFINEIVPLDPEVKSWAGVTRYFGDRIDSKRVQLFEFRARGNSGKIHLEFGKISEDINGDSKPFTEDFENNNEFLEEEDTGFDDLHDEEEPHYDPVTNPDPNHDNWYFLGDGDCPLPQDLCNKYSNPDVWDDSLYYEWLNGSEGNKIDYEQLESPDQEKLTERFQDDDGYFSYVIDFSDQFDPFRVDSSAFGDSTEINPSPKWYTFRIPIRDSSFMDDIVVQDESDETIQPDWTGVDIQHVRIWFEGEEGQTKADTIEIADWYFLQSNWRDTTIYGPNTDSSIITVASVSEEDGTFEAPSNVEAYTDPNTDVTESQQGLLIGFEDLDGDDIGMAVKSLLSIDSYSGYRGIEMYVHGNYYDELDDGSVTFFFRLGTDSLNYYEQQKRIYKGWDARNFVNITFDEITNLKDSQQRELPRGLWNTVNVYNDDSTLHVRGNPNLNQIKYFAAGVINNKDNDPVSGEIWLDELRVTDVRADVGTAGRFSIGGNLADLGNYNFSFQSQDPYFRGVSSSTRGGSSQNLGSGNTQTQMSYSASLNIDKFLPRSWGVRLPVSYSFSKNTQTPLLRTGSDIILPEEKRIEEQTINESRSISVNPSIKKQGSRNPLYSLLFNRLTTSFSYRRSIRTSVNTPYSFGESYNVRSSYDLGVKKPPTLPIFFWTKWIPIAKKTANSKLGLYPNRWTVSSEYNRNLLITDDINGVRRSSFDRKLNGKMNFSFKVFENLTTSLNLDTRRDLSAPDAIDLSLKNLKLGLEESFSQSFSVDYDPGLFTFISTDLSYKASYSDRWDRSTESLQSSFSRSWSVKGNFNHLRLLGGSGGRSALGRSKGRSRGGNKGETQSTDKPFYDPPLAVLRFLTGWVNPIQYSYGEQFGYTLPGMTKRPELKYRFGLITEPNVGTISQVRNPNSNISKTYSLSSGFKFLDGLNTDVKFSRTIKEDLIKQGSKYENITTNWPELNIRISRFSHIPLIKGFVNKIIDVFSPRTGYSRSTREQIDIIGGFKVSKTVTVSHSPLLAINFKVFRSLSLSSSINLSKETKETFVSTTGDFNSRQDNTRKTFAASTKYSFSAPSGFNIPLFGKIKFKSSVSISLDVKKNLSLSETLNSSGNKQITEKSDLAITPNITYSFSNQLTGGIRMRWTDSDTNGKKSHLREVSISVEIRF